MGERFFFEVGSGLWLPGRGMVLDVPFRRANSLLKQFIQILHVQFSGVTTAVKDTAAANQNVTFAEGGYGVNAGAGVTTSGIVIGTGTNGVAMTDFNLQTQVTANILHNAVSCVVENPSVGVWRAVASRAFTNNTGAVVNIKEVGLVAVSRITAWKFLIDRTLFSASIPIAAARTIWYRVSAIL